MRKSLRIVVTLPIIVCVFMGPVAASESPQTQPMITRLLLYGEGLTGMSEILAIDWVRDDSDRFARTGFCLRYRLETHMGHSIEAADGPEDTWEVKCFTTQERQVTFAAYAFGAEAVVQVTYENDLYSPWSPVATATRIK